MWDPAGGTRPRQLRGDSSNVATKTDSSGPGYVVMFDYGSVVFLHFTQQQQEVRRQKGFWWCFVWHLRMLGGSAFADLLTFILSPVGNG